MKQKHIEIRVRGKVQGVWFRKHTEIQAKNLKLCGYVKNCPDGSVFIEVLGHSKQVQELLDWCQTGSPEALVTAVETQISTATEHYSDFTIKR